MLEIKPWWPVKEVQREYNPPNHIPGEIVVSSAAAVGFRSAGVSRLRPSAFPLVSTWVALRTEGPHRSALGTPLSLTV